jgi:hypothetical protein
MALLEPGCSDRDFTGMGRLYLCFRAETAFQRSRQIELPHWFSQVGPRSEGGRLLYFMGIRNRGTYYDLQVRTNLQEALQRAKSVQLRHLDVEQNYIGIASFTQPLQRFQTVPGRFYAVRFQFKQKLQIAQHLRRVIHDEYRESALCVCS